MTAPAGGQWNDLQTRVISAIVMIAVGGVDIWLGGWPFTVLVLVLCGIMVWELVLMVLGPNSALGAVALGLAGTVSLGLATQVPGWVVPAALALVPFAMARMVPVAHRYLYVGYATMIMIACFGFVGLRSEGGIMAILWLVGVVIASDMMGYFAGRSLGGPKFWPAISPKKTWSGTVAGWVGAALVGLGFVLATDASWGLVILSPLVAFAGQLGDIAESWIKRRTGVKDSSALIPGHGGVLDRFDALIFAMVAVLIFGLFGTLPLATGN